MSHHSGAVGGGGVYIVKLIDWGRGVHFAELFKLSLMVIPEDRWLVSA